MDLLESGIPYRAAVGFLVGSGFALVFRVARCFDISMPAIAILFLYLIVQADLPIFIGVCIYGAYLVTAWKVVFQRLHHEMASTLVISVGMQMIILALTVMIFGDRLVAFADAQHQIEGNAGWLILFAPSSLNQVNLMKSYIQYLIE